MLLHPTTSKVDQIGTVTLRYMSKLHHIGIGRARKNGPIKRLIADRNIRVIGRAQAEDRAAHQPDTGRC